GDDHAPAGDGDSVDGKPEGHEEEAPRGRVRNDRGADRRQEEQDRRDDEEDPEHQVATSQPLATSSGWCTSSPRRSTYPSVLRHGSSSPAGVRPYAVPSRSSAVLRSARHDRR